MAIKLPAAQKVYTTKYDNFRGVDFTNDPSNVWYRRTPDGMNMLPDESGRPFKRTGWKKVVTADDFANLYASDNSQTAPKETSIRKCYYFELAGFDHIVIFTNYGVFLYRDGTLMSFNLSYNSSFIDSYDRAFFFEGGGKAAFYVYGDFKIWEYSYDETNGFVFAEAEPYIPRVNIAIDARHESGEAFENVNLLSDYIAEEYTDNAYSYISGAPTTSISSALVTVDELIFLGKASEQGTYVFTYTEADHSWLLAGDQVYIADYGIALDYNGTIPDGSTITVTMASEYRINLSKRITSIVGMEVWVSDETQFDKQLTLQASEAQTTMGYCTLVTPPVGTSYIKFYSSWFPLVSGEDAIRVIFPRNAAGTNSHSITMSVTARASQ